jgi:hypothetical protein
MQLPRSDAKPQSSFPDSQYFWHKRTSITKPLRGGAKKEVRSAPRASPIT